MDEDGRFIASAFLLNLPRMRIASNVKDLIDKFNENIRNILKQKYLGRQINVNFETYNAIKSRQSRIFRYIRCDLEKVWDGILKKYQDSVVHLTEDEEYIQECLIKDLEDQSNSRGMGIG